MARLEIGGTNGWHPEEIGVFDVTFTTRRVSRSLNKKITELNEKIRLATDDEEAFDALAEMMDALLEPAPGKRKKAGAILREKWEADELFLDQINAFSDQVQETATRPPTQTPS
jgi:hypothetical protein